MKYALPEGNGFSIYDGLTQRSIQSFARPFPTLSLWSKPHFYFIEEREIFAYHIEKQTFMSFGLPEEFHPLCIFFSDPFLLIGGKGGAKKIFAWDPVRNVQLPVDHPNVLKKFRKSIDDFFVWKDHIYALDNHIHPKYLLKYVQTKVQMQLLEQIRLPSQTPEERMYRGFMVGDLLVVLSKSSHRAGSTTYISLYKDFQCIRTLHWHKVPGFGFELSDIYDIQFHGNRLFLSTNLGLGILDLHESVQEGEVQLFREYKRIHQIIPLSQKKCILVIKKHSLTWMQIDLS